MPTIWQGNTTSSTKASPFSMRPTLQGGNSELRFHTSWRRPLRKLWVCLELGFQTGCSSCLSVGAWWPFDQLTGVGHPPGCQALTAKSTVRIIQGHQDFFLFYFEKEEPYLRN